jgi:hypothetical protein
VAAARIEAKTKQTTFMSRDPEEGRFARQNSHPYSGRSSAFVIAVTVIGDGARCRRFKLSAIALASFAMSPRSAAPRRGVASSPFGLQNFSVELFHERAGRLQIRKTPPKIDLAFSNNSPSIPCLNFSRPVKVHHPPPHFDIQFIVRDD